MVRGASRRIVPTRAAGLGEKGPVMPAVHINPDRVPFLSSGNHSRGNFAQSVFSPDATNVEIRNPGPECSFGELCTTNDRFV
jgi:hypothetical protein